MVVFIGRPCRDRGLFYSYCPIARKFTSYGEVNCTSFHITPASASSVPASRAYLESRAPLALGRGDLKKVE